MISQKFSATTENQLISFMSKDENQREDESVQDAIESVSDLWLLANINKSYNEENNICRVADSNSDVCSPD